jgi:hypothetical protein
LDHDDNAATTVAALSLTHPKASIGRNTGKEVVVRVFIAGIMQGSRCGGGIDAQDYRREVAQIVRRHVPGVEVLDPFALHPDSATYSPERAKRTLLELTTLAGQVDVLIAYVPSATMGTAIEMWSAHQNGVRVYTISPLAGNWVVHSLSERVFPDIAAFAAFVADGKLSNPKA